MSLNKALAAQLTEIAQMLELLGENPFKVNAHTRAARILRDMAQPIEDLAGDRAALVAINGIGPKIADKIIEYVQTGSITEHEKLSARVPKGLMELLHIPGLGPKTVRMLWKDRGVTDLAGLEAIIEDGSILELPRMGKKAVEKIQRAIAFSRQQTGRYSIGVVMPLGEAIVQALKTRVDLSDISLAGSLRRGKETIGDIDILACSKHPEQVHEALVNLPEVIEVLAHGSTKSSVRIALNPPSDRWNNTPDADTTQAIQVDLRTIDEASWGAALLYFTGSKAHSVRLRERALSMDLTLNEYGLYPNDDDPTPPQTRQITPVAAKTERAIYAKLNLPCIPPELREDRGELELTSTPPLIEVGNIKAECHAHTTESDGKLSLDQLVSLAHDRGFHTIAVTDHSQSATIANGLSVKRLKNQRKAIEAYRDTRSDIAILHGCEVDILADGSLDFDDDILNWLDIVVASPHAALSQDTATATKRLLKAIENPHVNIIGHPTGRLINKRKGLEPEMSELYAACVEHDVALEINAHPMRLDLRDIHVHAAVEAGCLIAIDCDVHRAEDFDNLRYGVLTGRRGWLDPKGCINTWSKTKLHKWIRKKHAT